MSEPVDGIRFAAQPHPRAVCPFCHDDLMPETEVVTCGGCGAPYHTDCLGGELITCATLGCEVRPELGNRGPWRDLNDRGRQSLLVGQALSLRRPSLLSEVPQLRVWLFVLGCAVALFVFRWIWMGM